MLDPVRWSYLREMRRSPAHYKYALTAPRVETAAMRLGTAVHGRVLQGLDYIVYDGIRRGKEWEAFKARCDGETILSPVEGETLAAIADSIRSNPLAMRVLEGAPERRIEWTVAGRACAGTPDVIGNGFIADLKITNDASPERFPFHARRMGWHAQLAWYANGLGSNGNDLFIVAAEAKPPHPVVVYQLSPSAIDMGERTWRGCFERLLVAEATDSWPGYTEAVQQLDAIEDFQLDIDGEAVEL